MYIICKGDPYLTKLHRVNLNWCDLRTAEPFVLPKYLFTDITTLLSINCLLFSFRAKPYYKNKISKYLFIYFSVADAPKVNKIACKNLTKIALYQIKPFQYGKQCLPSEPCFNDFCECFFHVVLLLLIL